MSNFLGKYGLPDTHYTFEEHPAEYVKNSDKITSDFLEKHYLNSNSIGRSDYFIERNFLNHPKATRKMIENAKYYGRETVLQSDNPHIDKTILTKYLTDELNHQYSRINIIQDITKHHAFDDTHIDHILNAGIYDKGVHDNIIHNPKFRHDQITRMLSDELKYRYPQVDKCRAMLAHPNAKQVHRNMVNNANINPTVKEQILK